MSTLPDGRRGKALALGLLALLALAFHLAILSPVLAVYEERAERLEQRRELARRYENAAKDLPRLRASAEEGGEASPDEDLLLTGSSDAIAAAMLQSQLKELVEEEGATLASAAMLPAADAGAFRRVGVRVAFAGDLTLLTSVLRNLDEERPVLATGNFELRAGNAEDSDDNPTLTVALDVFGYRAK
jgi:general secretion pathway protein M